MLARGGIELAQHAGSVAPVAAQAISRVRILHFAQRPWVDAIGLDVRKEPRHRRESLVAGHQRQRQRVWPQRRARLRAAAEGGACAVEPTSRAVLGNAVALLAPHLVAIALGRPDLKGIHGLSRTG